MCILFFAINQHPQYPVVICANRDEFHQRPTQAMHLWSQPEILAGKDLQAGGTWLGINQNGSFAALTNYRQGGKLDPMKKSRGDLVLNALKENRTTSAEQNSFLKELITTAEQYNGYNLVYGPLNNLQCFDSINQKAQTLSNGFHSICNGALDDIWPKMALGQQKLAQLIKHSDELSIEQLFILMTDQSQAQPKQLPQTGIPTEFEQLLSSIFIVSPQYGTRSTTIITLSTLNNIEVYERSYNQDGCVVAQQSFSLAEHRQFDNGNNN